jgi:hypothetical protein
MKRSKRLNRSKGLYLEIQDHAPNKTKNDGGFAVDDVRRVDADHVDVWTSLFESFKRVLDDVDLVDSRCTSLARKSFTVSE